MFTSISRSPVTMFGMHKSRETKPRTKSSAPVVGEKNEVNFRILSPAVMEELTRRADAAGKSVGLFARDLVIDALANGSAKEEQSAHVEEMKDQLADVATLVRRIRGDIATSTRMLLMSCGDEDSEKATQWVRDHLMK